MVEYNFKSQICTTREQSQKLLSLGLKKETADMYYRTNWINAVAANDIIDLYEDDIIPAWSVHRLIEMMPVSLPCEIEGMQGLFSLTRRDDGSVTVGYTWSLERTGNIYDAMISAIEWLIKNEDFSNEYVA